MCVWTSITPCAERPKKRLTRTHRALANGVRVRRVAIGVAGGPRGSLVGPRAPSKHTVRLQCAFRGSERARPPGHYHLSRPTPCGAAAYTLMPYTHSKSISRTLTTEGPSSALDSRRSLAQIQDTVGSCGNDACTYPVRGSRPGEPAPVPKQPCSAPLTCAHSWSRW